MPPNNYGLLSQYAPPQDDGLMGFLKSPEAMVFAGGLLSGNGTFAQSLGQGLTAATQARLKQDPLNQFLKFQQSQLAGAQIQDLQSQQQEREKRANLLGDILNKPETLNQTMTNVSETTKPKQTISKEQRDRASLLYSLGDIGGAIKILTEKPEKDKSTEATQQFLSQNQKIIQSADNLIPILDDIIKSDVPLQTNIGVNVGSIFSPDKQAKYQSDVITVAEGLMSARNLPQTEGSLKKMTDVVQRQPLESEKAYKTRLRELRKEILDRRKKAEKITNVGSTQESIENIQSEEGNDPLGLFS